VTYTETVFDGNGRAKESKGRVGTAAATYSGATRKTVYTSGGRTDLVKTPQPGSTSSFDWATDPVYVVDNDYDAAGRLDTVTADDPDGGTADLVTTFTFDDDGQRLTTTTPDGTVTATVYDDVGNVLTTTRQGTTAGDTSDDLQQVRTWSSAGQVATETDWNPLGVSSPAVKAFTYNDRGLLTEVTDLNGTLVCYDYDERSNRVHRRSWQSFDASYSCATTTDAIDEYWGFNLADQTLEERNPDGDSTATNANDVLYTYDSDTGRVSTVTDGTGRVETRTYSDAGLLSRRAYSGTAATDVTVDYLYDYAGRVTGIDDGRTNSIGYTYDYTGNIVSLKTPNIADTGQDTTTWVWDIVGDKTQVSFPDGRDLRWRYDAAGRATAVDGDFYHWLPLAERTYDTAGRPTREQRVDGSYQTWGYDTQGRVQRYRIVDDSQVRITELAYGSTGRLSGERTEIDGVATDDLTYSYDSAGQLTAATAATGTHPDLTYSYDDHGNRATKTQDSVTTDYTYNDFDQLSSATITSDRKWTYTWDDAGRRTGWDLDDISSGTVALQSHTTTYDEAGLQGNRTGTKDPDGTPSELYDIAYTYDGNRQLVGLEISDAGAASVTRGHIWDPTTAIPQYLAVYDDNSDITARDTGYGTVDTTGLFDRTEYDRSTVADTNHTHQPHHTRQRIRPIR